MTPVWRVLGVDFGQAQDWTAAVFLEWPRGLPEPHYQLRDIRRWELGTKYTDIVRDLVSLSAEPHMEGAVLVCDDTGCGKPVLNMLGEELGKVQTRAAGMVGVTVTAGSTQSQVTGHHGYWRVAKIRLVSTLVCAMQQRRLHVAKTLTLAGLLGKELANYRVKLTAAGNETFDAYRDGQANDDIVFAAMLGIWAGENLRIFRAKRRAGECVPDREGVR